MRHIVTNIAKSKDTYLLLRNKARLTSDLPTRNKQALTDYPASIFPQELIASYPEAQVILTTRSSPEKWCESMQATLIPHHLSRSPDDPAPTARLARKYHEHCWDDDFARNGMDVYGSHNEAVRKASAGRRFLEYRPGDGWGPLCEFLGVRIPEVEFPRSDEWGDFKSRVGVAAPGWVPWAGQ